LIFERRLAFLQRNRWRLFVLVGGYGLLSGAISLFVPAGWWSGAYSGAVCVGLLWAVSWFASLDGTLFARAGSWAEEWTSQALRKNAAGCAVVDDVPLGGRNLDHVLVGPGGVVAVETKWKSKWRDRQHKLKDLELERAQAALQAEELQTILHSLGHSVRVRPMVVAWGPGIPTDETFVGFGAVGMLVGDRWRDWPERALARDSLSPHDVEEIAMELSRFAEEYSMPEPSATRKTIRLAKALFAPALNR